MLDLELYLVEFNLEEKIKNMIYFDDYQVRNTNCQSIIVMTYDKYIFFDNDKKAYKWQCKKITFFCLKKK